MSWIEQEMGEIVKLNEKIRSEFSAIGADQMDWKPDSKTSTISFKCHPIVLRARHCSVVGQCVASGGPRRGGAFSIVALSNHTTHDDPM